MECKGEKGITYSKALNYTRLQCGVQGIDAALKFDGQNGDTVEFDALLLCDRKGAGQQLAAQAGMPISELVTCFPGKGV